MPVFTSTDIDDFHASPLNDDLLNTYAEVWSFGWEAVAELARQDRFFLLVHLLGREDCVHPWIYARCREVEADPYGHLDLWPREHYKSTIITQAGTIQNIVSDADVTVGIFSHNNATANRFLWQVKTELESNEKLKKCYPEVLYAKPERDSPRWSVDRLRGRPSRPSSCRRYGPPNGLRLRS